jgi:hypothetical protein
MNTFPIYCYGGLKHNRVFLASFMLLFVVFSGCKKESIEFPIDKSLLLPIGRTALFDVLVVADSVITKYDIVDSPFGGRYIKIPFRKLNPNTVVYVRFTKKAGPLDLFREEGPADDMWLRTSSYIDPGHPAIIQKARHLTDEAQPFGVKARNIQLFVAGHLQFAIYKDSGTVSASTSLEMGYGTCINFSRLFIALCRAAGVPARSVWGSIRAGNNYNAHHNWAEFMDEQGYWHPLDMSFTQEFDLNDLRYLDLQYGVEESPHVQEYHSFVVSVSGDIYYYDGSENAVDGKLNVSILEDEMPDYVRLMMTFDLSKLFNE